MSQSKDLTEQSYEKKIVNTLREEKFKLDSIKKNLDFIKNLSLMGDEVSWANKFYIAEIDKTHELYKHDFERLILPMVIEKGMGFEIPEENIAELKNKYEQKVTRLIELIQIMAKIKMEPFYSQSSLSTLWTVCFNRVNHIPFLIGLGAQKIMIFDPSFNMNLHFFASLGAMPDIRPLPSVGNIQMPPDTYLVNLQVMIGSTFKQASIILIKHLPENMTNLQMFMNNVFMVVDTKLDIDDDFSGLKWVKNSFQHSLFKKKYFLEVAKSLKLGGLIIDKAVSPMQVQKIQTLVKSSLNLNIGFELYKIGTTQYSFIQKRENVNIVFDSFESIICKMPDFVSNMGSNRTSTY